MEPQRRRGEYDGHWKWIGIVGLCLIPFTVIGMLWFVVRIQNMDIHRAQCRASAYCMLWYNDWGGERERLSMPLGEREQRIWDGVVSVARSKGITFIEPQVRQTTPEGDALRPADGEDMYGMAYSSGRILLSSRHLAEMDDADVAFVMAHELGHQVDNQSERMGHEAYDSLRFAGSQEFANGIAAYLYGQDAVDRWNTTWNFVPFWKYFLER